MGTKRIKLSGSAVWIGGFPLISLQSASNFIRNRVQSLGGWDIKNWVFIDQGANQWGCPCNFLINIEAHVSDTYSDFEHRDYVTAEINAYRFSSIFASVPVIKDIRLQPQSSDIVTGVPNAPPPPSGLTPGQIEEIIRNSRTPPPPPGVKPEFELPEFLKSQTGILVIAAIAYLIFTD